MQFEHFLTRISKLREPELPGVEAHRKMIPTERIIPSMDQIHNARPKRAAVLALFYPDNAENTRFLLTLRANYHGTHASQISFPGGKFEIGDLNLEQTALRETHEETGVAINAIQIRRALSETYIPPSNFLVRPYLATCGKKPEFSPNHEVERIIEVSLKDLLDERSVSVKNLSTSYMSNIDVPCYRFEGDIVWGATAMMLSEIKELFKLTFH